MERSLIKIIQMMLILTSLSCGVKAPPLSHVKKILGDEPQWNQLNPDETDPFVFKILLDDLFIGNGFLFKNHIITNNHVASALRFCFSKDIDCKNWIAKNHYTEIKINKILVSDTYIDIAILEIESNCFNNAKEITANSKQLSLGEKVVLKGFSSDENFVEAFGEITGIEYDRKIKPSFHHTSDTLPGMSGSPIFNNKGEIIGIHWGSGEDFNQAIPIHLILNLFEKAKL